MKVLIIGSGTWGTALAQVLNDNGHEVIIYGNITSQVEDIEKNHKNSFYFGDEITLSENIHATDKLEVAVKDKDIILLSVPTGAMRSVLNRLLPLLEDKKYIFINTAKGFDESTKKRMSELVKEIIPNEKMEAFVSLIGPSHAEEVIVRDLTCISAVSTNKEVAFKVAELFKNNYFRVYPGNDEVGSELGVAMKNAIALCSGILEGLGYGDNARAALCSRGLAEMVRFATKFGANPNTFLGLTGVGDLVVTCYSFHSRNFSAGLEIGKADDANEFLKNNTKTVEGIRACRIIYEIAQKEDIELPITSALYRILFENVKPSEVVSSLMDRPIKQER